MSENDKRANPVLTLLTGHWLTLLGSGLVTTAVISWLFVLPLSVRGHVTDAYIGIILFIAIPIVFFAGLAIIPIGIWLSKRRIRAGLAETPDRRVTLHRIAWFFAITTAANVLIASQVTYRAVSYMDTEQFCGQTCHVMNPEYSAYLVSKHSSVACADCHIAPGAAGWFHAKMNGTRQLFEVTLHNYPTPIPGAYFSGRLVGTEGTCQHCHAAHNSPQYRLRIIRHYTDDQQTKQNNTVLLMKIMGPHGIHGVHLAPGVTIRYSATDAQRENVPWVEYSDPQTHTVRTFTSGDAKPPGPVYTMTCIDCHSRPAHSFEQAEDAVDHALASGRISPALPYIRKEGVEVLKGSSSDQQIQQKITAYYQGQDATAVRQAAETLAAIYKRNVFPEMKVTWGTYPNLLGHTNVTGCFRCHDGSHAAQDGSSITQDCNTCHQTVATDDPSPDVLKTLGIPTSNESQEPK